jgi:5-methylcytosine-specific restriction protein A
MTETITVKSGRINWTRDEIILACELVEKNGWKSLESIDMRVIELSKLLQANPLHSDNIRTATFRNPNGVAMKTANIATSNPDYAGKGTNGNRLDQEVLLMFLAEPERMRAAAREIRAEIVLGTFVPSAEDHLDDEEYGVMEGKLLLSRHRRRERDPKLRRLKIERAKKAGRSVSCEICSFDFGVTYGNRGEDFIEVHHILPLHASGEVRTKLADLIMLCSNCHRMIHRGNPWLNPAELQNLLHERRMFHSAT